MADSDNFRESFKYQVLKEISDIDKRISIVETVFRTAEEQRTDLREDLELVKEKHIRELEERLTTKLRDVGRGCEADFKRLEGEIVSLKNDVSSIEKSITQNPILGWTSELTFKKTLIVIAAVISLITSFNATDFFINSNNQEQVLELERNIERLIKELEENENN